MTSFTFTPEQVRSAPLEVRRWIEHEVATTLAALSKSEHDPSEVHAAALAACMPQEAAEVFELIKGNFLLSQVYFELARETPSSPGSPPLHALSIAEILRHTRLADGDRLVDCFTAINQAFQTIRNDPEATLFGFDQYGHVFIHQTTHDKHSSALAAFVRCPCADGRRTGRSSRGTGPGRFHAASPRTERGRRSAHAGSGQCQLLNGSLK
jgi:hypothetical protein